METTTQTFTTARIMDALREVIEGDQREATGELVKQATQALTNEEDPRIAGMAAEISAHLLLGDIHGGMHSLRMAMLSMLIGGYQLGKKDAEIQQLERISQA